MAEVPADNVLPEPARKISPLAPDIATRPPLGRMQPPAQGTPAAEGVGQGPGRKDDSPVKVSPLIKFARYSGLLLGKKKYGKKRYYNLKPIAAEERRIEEEEKREEMEHTAKALAKASKDAILK
uniref:ATP synthase subunit e, mitochondrial-like n=1 Tax=Euleptes europaea TaxID=460621 RepID=UPI00253FDBC0|nr:ATP synthase subunit e, mitochondrial-like [Euleptes europaea]